MEVVVDIPVVRMSAPPAARTSVATISAVISAAPRSFDTPVILRFEVEAELIISLPRRNRELLSTCLISNCEELRQKLTACGNWAGNPVNLACQPAGYRCRPL